MCSEYFHLLSTNEKSQHGLCKKGKESWSSTGTHRRAIANKKTYNHLNHMHFQGVIIDQAFIQALADPLLLKKFPVVNVMNW